MTRGTTQIARLCAPLQALTCPMHLRSIHGRRLQGFAIRSDLRLGRDGMKLQPAGSHHTRLSAGPPAVPSSSQPCYEIERILAHEPHIVNTIHLAFSLRGFGTPGERASGSFSVERCRVWCASRYNGRGTRAIPIGSPGRCRNARQTAFPSRGAERLPNSLPLEGKVAQRAG